MKDPTYYKVTQVVESTLEHAYWVKADSEQEALERFADNHINGIVDIEIIAEERGEPQVKGKVEGREAVFLDGQLSRSKQPF